MPARSAATAALAAAIAVIGCDRKPERAGPATGADPASTEAACAGAERHGGDLAWFSDDYPRALACARARKVPLVIDMWAPWCHTCLSMQSYVLTDEALAPYGRSYVFLALDTDREVNAAAVAKFPPAAWPTFFVVSSADEAIQARFVGGASVEQFTAFLAPHVAGRDASLPPAEAAARDGDRAASARAWAAAEAAYGLALSLAPADWPRRPDVLVSTLQVMSRQNEWSDCAGFALAHMDRTGKAASATDFAGYALRCADALAEKVPAQAQQVRERVVARLAALVADAAAPLTLDDRADALMYLREAYDALGMKDVARQTAERQRAMLDDAAAKAPDPRAASTYNWPRAEVYTYLGIGLELVPALERSAADLPKEYDPPHRLAWVYWKAGKLDLAKQWAEQAAGLVYGPRKTRTLAMLADIEKARGDAAAERAARAAIVETWEKLPPEAQSADALAKARAELAALDGPAK